MIYQNEKLRIVPFSRGHLSEQYRGWFHDPDTTRFNSHGLFPYTTAQMEAFVRDIEQGSTSRIVWAIEMPNPEYERWKNAGRGSVAEIAKPPSTWKHVGNVSLQSINFINRSAEIAIVIGEAEARGKGYGLQACQWVLSHAFLKLNLHRIWTGTAATNIGMNKICFKLGMVAEGVFRDGMFLDGKHVDINAWGFVRPCGNELIKGAIN